VRTIAAACVAAALASGAVAEARVAHRFVGVVAGYEILNATGAIEREYDAMVSAGAGSVRDQLTWRAAQPYASWDEVPPERRGSFRDEEGVPTDWMLSDLQVRLAAARRMRVMPVVQSSPDWAARQPGDLWSPPRDPQSYARFLAALVRRYGPNGSFWAENPELPRRPVRDWQIWNEPHFRQFWSDQPYERDYVALLRSAHAAIKAADPGARVVLAGLANTSWVYLRDIYRAGARPYFDIIALHPFTAQVAGVFEILRRGRRVARRFGDARKPLTVTEFTWSSGKGELTTSYGWDATERGQARRVRESLTLLARERRRMRIDSVFWYTWLSRDSNRNYPFDYSGLRRLEDGGQVVRKPAFKAFRATALRLVGCRSKAGAADRCAP
jgi:hypothetical protein